MNIFVVGVAQWLEHQVVALGAEGSSPFIHPLLFNIKKADAAPHRLSCFRVFGYSTAAAFRLMLSLKPALAPGLLLDRLRRSLLATARRLLSVGAAVAARARFRAAAVLSGAAVAARARFPEAAELCGAAVAARARFPVAAVLSGAAAAARARFRVAAVLSGAAAAARVRFRAAAVLSGAAAAARVRFRVAAVLSGAAVAARALLSSPWLLYDPGLRAARLGLLEYRRLGSYGPFRTCFVTVGPHTGLILVRLTNRLLFMNARPLVFILPRGAQPVSVRLGSVFSRLGQPGFFTALIGFFLHIQSCAFSPVPVRIKRRFFPHRLFCFQADLAVPAQTV